MEIELTENIAKKVKETVECGLSNGLGKPVPGQMCIEAAVNYAYGLSHGDNPPCVGSAVRSFKIRLNDAKWSSNKARAEGMIEISIAQLNSNQLDQKEFSKRITIKIINTIIADLAITYKPEIEESLRGVVDLTEAIKLCNELRAYAAYAANAAANAADAAAYAADAAAYAADAAAYATNAAANAAVAAAYATNAAANAAADAAVAAAYAANAAVAAAVAAAKSKKGDSILKKAANLCLEVLKEMKSEGCKYLYLLDKAVD